jgi:hypothetical protein
MNYRCKSLLVYFFVLSSTLGLSVKVWAQAKLYQRSAEIESVEEEFEEIFEPIVVRVTGYGAFEKKEDAKSESKRLMAIRASKLDAYRALAERVYGTGIVGSSSVQDFVLKHDGFGVVVDSFVRGARVVSIVENKEAGFETVLELLVPGNFQDCLNKVNSFKGGANCFRPLPASGNHSSARGQGSKSRPSNNAMQSGYFLN